MGRDLCRWNLTSTRDLKTEYQAQPAVHRLEKDFGKQTHPLTQHVTVDQLETQWHGDGVSRKPGRSGGKEHVPRTVLEWHLDPANGYRHPAVTSLDQPLVLVCNRGYSSSLAAGHLDW